MAAMIRKAIPNAEVTELYARQRRLTIHPTAERLQYKVATLSKVAPQFLSTYANLRGKSTEGAWHYVEGKMAEQMVAEVLRDDPEFGLTITEITTSTGVDVTGSKGMNIYYVEVKKRNLDKSFADLLTDEEGKPRQCSDAWLEKSGVTDLKRAIVLGARVNPQKGTMCLYRRRDSNAQYWDLIKEVPLSASESARDLYGI